MGKMIKITSLQNPHIQLVRKLKKRRVRNQTDLFLIEGYRELKRALEANFFIEKLFFSPEHFLKDNEQALIQKILAKKALAFECGKTIFEKISYRDRPDGLFAISRQKHLDITDLEKILQKKKAPVFLVAQSIEKPGNLGTILRSCDAAGIDAVIVCDACTDIYNPNVVRSSIGTLFTNPVIEAASDELLHLFKRYKVKIIAASPLATQEFTKTPMKPPLAIAVGSEQYGLDAKWMQECSIQVKIPMHGLVDSLNVATATTLLLYEVLRQKNSSF